MKLYYTSVFRKKLDKVIKTDKLLAASIKQTLEKLASNEVYPSFRLHKLSGNQSSAWSISVNKSIRIVFYYVEDGVVLVNFGKHEEVY